MRTELIVSTYNSPRALDALPDLGRVPDARCPTRSASPTTARARRPPPPSPPSRRRTRSSPLRHVWHEDRGFEKAAILNKAIATSEAEFLVFIDGDVLIHPAFIARHLELARPGRFSTGSLIRLDAAATALVTPELIETGAVFDRDWLRAHRAIDRLGTWLKTMPFPKPVMAALDARDPGAAGALRRQRLAVPRRRAEGQRLRRERSSTAAATRSSACGWRTPASAASTCATPRRWCISTTRAATATRRRSAAHKALIREVRRVGPVLDPRRHREAAAMAEARAGVGRAAGSARAPARPRRAGGCAAGYDARYDFRTLVYDAVRGARARGGPALLPEAR